MYSLVSEFCVCLHACMRVICDMYASIHSVVCVQIPHNCHCLLLQLLAFMCCCACLRANLQAHDCLCQACLHSKFIPALSRQQLIWGPADYYFCCNQARATMRHIACIVCTHAILARDCLLACNCTACLCASIIHSSLRCVMLYRPPCLLAIDCKLALCV